jgi:C1A family cysteine protease
MGLRRHGWVPDVPDHRDYVYAAKQGLKLPSATDLRAHCPPVYDQGNLGSCTANAACAAIVFDLMKSGHKHGDLSRLFAYYNARVIERSVKSDSGATIRDIVKSVAKCGAPLEKEWPYSDEDPGLFEQKPNAKAYTDGLQHKVTSYSRVGQTLSQMRACLAEGYPFVFGFSVFEGFETEQVAKTGVVDMPTSDEQCLGGHAVMAVGYDNHSQRFLVRNSWGSTWGLKGYFTIPYAYLLDTDLAADFWTLRAIATSA